MTTVVICTECAREIERYEGPGPYREQPDGLCVSCASTAETFDMGFAEYEERMRVDDDA
jgi:hypothetical protein